MISNGKLLVILGFFLLGLGAIGVFLPILPTTPFVLAAAGCFSGNKRLSGWLHKSKFFSDYLTSYNERTGLKKRTVIISLVYLWIMLGISIVWLKTLWASIFLPMIGIAVTVHILYMSLPKDRTSRSQNIKPDDYEW